MKNSRRAATRTVLRILRTGVAGYEQSRAAERATLGMASSFAATIAISRRINYAREQRRMMPAARSVGRIIAQIPGDNRARIHHFLPGLGIGIAAGGSAILSGTGRVDRGLSVPFGVGVALITDELRLLAGRNNPYWGSERFAWTQCAAGSLLALGLVGLFWRRGHAAGWTVSAARGTRSPSGSRRSVLDVTGWVQGSEGTDDHRED